MMSAGNLPHFLSWTHLIEAAEYTGSEQSRQAQSRADRLRAEQIGSEQSRQAQSRADRLRAEQTGSEQIRQAQSRADRLRAKQTGSEKSRKTGSYRLSDFVFPTAKVISWEAASVF